MYINTQKGEDMSKFKRQQLIKKIISQNTVLDQLQIVKFLIANGIDTTQATISRDLQELGIIKIPLKSGEYQYQLFSTESGNVLKNKLQILFTNFVDEVIRAKNQIIVKTTSGNANGVASFIDRLNISGILGTIAGDDTILIISQDDKHGKLIEKKLNNLINK